MLGFSSGCLFRSKVARASAAQKRPLSRLQVSALPCRQSFFAPFSLALSLSWAAAFLLCCCVAVGLSQRFDSRLALFGEDEIGGCGEEGSGNGAPDDAAALEVVRDGGRDADRAHLPAAAPRAAVEGACDSHGEGADAGGPGRLAGRALGG